MIITLAEDEMIKVLIEHVKTMIGAPDLEFDDASDGFSCADENSAEIVPDGLKFSITI